MRANLRVEMREREMYEAWHMHLSQRLHTTGLHEATRLRPTLRAILRAVWKMHCP